MDRIYFIAEIGQNHNGCIKTARTLIDKAARAGANGVKFCKRDLSCELSAVGGMDSYDGPHSYGRTYLEHRRALELTEDQHVWLWEHSKRRGVDFIETICGPGALSLLDRIEVAAIKVASRDMDNVPLLEAIAARHEPVILSTGMSGLDEIRAALRIIDRPNGWVTLLHCESQYPAPDKDLNLRAIQRLAAEFPGIRIGYSDHSVSDFAIPAAIALGARVIEKHVTLDRSGKGSDHACSLEPEQLTKCIAEVRGLAAALDKPEKSASAGSLRTKLRIGRSLANIRAIRKGQTVDESNLVMVSPGYGLRWEDRALLAGRAATVDLPPMSVLGWDCFQKENERDSRTTGDSRTGSHRSADVLQPAAQ